MGGINSVDILEILLDIDRLAEDSNDVRTFEEAIESRVCSHGNKFYCSRRYCTDK